MLDMLKLRVLRWLAGIMVTRNWRGQLAQNLDIAEHEVPVEGGRIRVRC
jgi:hypothetical protein